MAPGASRRPTGLPRPSAAPSSGEKEIYDPLGAISAIFAGIETNPVDLRLGRRRNLKRSTSDLPRCGSASREPFALSEVAERRDGSVRTTQIADSIPATLSRPHLVSMGVQTDCPASSGYTMLDVPSSNVELAMAKESSEASQRRADGKSHDKVDDAGRGPQVEFLALPPIGVAAFATESESSNAGRVFDFCQSLQSSKVLQQEYHQPQTSEVGMQTWCEIMESMTQTSCEMTACATQTSQVMIESEVQTLPPQVFVAYLEQEVQTAPDNSDCAVQTLQGELVNPNVEMQTLVSSFKCRENVSRSQEPVIAQVKNTETQTDCNGDATFFLAQFGSERRGMGTGQDSVGSPPGQVVVQAAESGEVQSSVSEIVSSSPITHNVEIQVGGNLQLSDSNAADQSLVLKELAELHCLCAQQKEAIQEQNAKAVELDELRVLCTQQKESLRQRATELKAMKTTVAAARSKQDEERSVYLAKINELSSRLQVQTTDMEQLRIKLSEEQALSVRQSKTIQRQEKELASMKGPGETIRCTSQPPGRRGELLAQDRSRTGSLPPLVSAESSRSHVPRPGALPLVPNELARGPTKAKITTLSDIR